MTTSTGRDFEASAGEFGKAGARRGTECAVLNCLLLGGKLEEAKAFVSPANFASPDTRALAEAFWNAPENHDSSAVFVEVAGCNGNQALLSDVPGAMGIPSNTAAYSQILAKHCRRAELTAMFAEALNDLPKSDPDQILARFRDLPSLSAPSLTMRDAVNDAIRDAEKAVEMKASGRPAGIPTGLPVVDRRTGGFLPGDMWVGVAETSAGKSALAIQVARHAAKRGRKMGYITLEMPAGDIGRRSMASEGGVNGTQLRTGDHGALQKAKAIAPKLSDLPILIDTNADTHETIESRLYQWHAQGVEVITLDHLMCVQYGRDQNADQMKLMSMFRRFNMRTGVSLHVITQYRKELNGKGRGIQDIYGSAAVIQYAPTVYALHGDTAGPDMRRIEFYKNRDGVTGLLPVKFQFDGATQTLRELAPGGSAYCHEDPREELFA